MRVTNIVKLEKNDTGDKIRYFLFRKLKGEKWKEKYISVRIASNQEYPDPTNLTDFEYFLKLFPEPLFDQYAIIIDDKIAGYASIDEGDDEFCSIYIEIYPEYRSKGLATQLTIFIEEDLFKQDTIQGLMILDYSEHRESTKIAKKLGYEKRMDKMYGPYYVKINPNYKSNNMKK